MFSKILKILLFVFSVFVLLFLVSFSFFTKKQNLNKNEEFILNNQIWDYSLIDNKGDIEAVSGIKEKSKAYFKKINYFDNVYFSNLNSFSVSDKTDSMNIKVSSWAYIFDLNNLDKNYKIISDSFEADLIWVWKVYMEINSQKVFIFSLSSTIKIDFKEKTSLKKVSSMYLFPHDYIKFDPNKNKFLVNADLFRIKTIINNWYIKAKITDEKDISEYKNIQTYINNDFIKTSISYINSRISIDKKNYQKLSFKVAINYPLKDYIEKYFVLFINDTKKESYYKNLIINDLLLLVKSDKEENIIVQNIKTNLSNLQSFSKTWYDDILAYIDTYYEIIIKNNDSKKYYAIKNFRNLKDKKQTNNNSYLKDIIYLQNMYIDYDFLEESNIKNQLYNFTNIFFSNFKIEENKFFFTKDNDFFFMESFASYLENQIKTFLFIDWVSDIKQDLVILNNYLFLVNSVYFDWKTDEIIKTWLRKNPDFLILIFDFISNNVFEKRENKDDLLINSKNFTLNKNDISELKESKDLILSFFSKNKKVIDDKLDWVLSKMYFEYASIFNEYFLALDNYESYVQRFDEKQKELLWFTPVLQEDKVYTKTDIISYLQEFNFADISKIKLSNIDNSWFKVSNYIVSWNIFSFDIFPKESNKIEKIIINWQSKTSSYILDDRKERMDERLKWESGENAYLYDFKNFFTLTFNSTSNPSQITEQYRNPEEQEEETKVVVVFKRDTLLWKKWEFYFLKWFLDIDYSDIKVIDLSNIFIKDASLNVLVSNSSSDSRTYNSKFDSSYVINLSKKLHYFKDIKLSISNNENELFWWAKLNLIWNIDLSSFKTKIETIFKDIDKMNLVFASIDWLVSSVDYDLTSSKTIFKFEKSGKIIKISLFWDNIVSLTDESREYITKPIYYSDLNSILKQIK